MYNVRKRIVIQIVSASARNLKNARIDLRISDDQKALLEQAAASQGKKLTDFVIGASTDAAQLALADQNRFALEEEPMRAFLQLLEKDPEVVPGLRRLFDRKSVFE